MFNDMKKILIVEDDGMLRKVLIDAFTRSYTVMDASTGEMGWQKITFQLPDLILLDLMLPELSGIDLLKRIRKSEDQKIAHVPVIIISNLSDQKTIAEAKTLGIDDYFVKSSVEIGEIISRIELALNQQPPTA